IKINILDSRGAIVEDAKVIVSRGGKELERQSNTSGVMFLLPPGAYTVKVYNENDLIGARKINVFSQRSFDIITATEPLFSLLVTVSAVVFALVGLIFTYIKKDIMYFLKILAVSLVLIAVVSPWWMLQGSTTSVETSTTMYLTPLELITTTTSIDVISGELAFLPELFIDVVSLIPIFTILACLFILSSIYFKKRGTKLYLSLQLLTILMLISSILIFSIGMNELAEVGIGSFIGERNLEVSIPGEEMAAHIDCSWGPSAGFYLYVLSIIILILIIIFNVKKIMEKKG
ncbi:MAG: carboxypeptidase regulatory-like domain-containing protein, partial [Thermoplasmatales archaeon]|nr:carboxypeptidase regulatory-like domain-containing protein [Thermoplasmatales archaeon]